MICSQSKARLRKRSHSGSTPKSHLRRDWLLRKSPPSISSLSSSIHAPTILGDFPLVGDVLKAIDLLNQAVARDPSFFKAYCLLAAAHDQLYFVGDHTPGRLAAAEAAVEKAFRIRPNAGEAHLARAFHLYNGYLEYDGALAELEIARRSLPNTPRIFSVTG